MLGKQRSGKGHDVGCGVERVAWLAVLLGLHTSLSAVGLSVRGRQTADKKKCRVCAFHS